MRNILNKDFLIYPIILLAAFLRINRISEYLTFLGDEGRDVLIVRGILHGDLVFLGPRASAADFFTGPVYYYMMAPFLFLSNYNPVGPAIMVALLSVATVYLIYRFGKEWFNPTAALIAAGLYAISPLVIQYSRSSWNPNPMPFFTIVILYLLYKGIQKPTILRFALIGVLYGIAFQLHYIELFVGIIIGVYLFIGNFLAGKKDFLLKIIKQYASIFAGFIIGMSPFLAFEIKHGFPNIRTVLNFAIHGDPDAPDLTDAGYPEIVGNVFFRLFARLVTYFPTPDHISWYSKEAISVWFWGSLVLGIAATLLLVYQLYKSFKTNKNKKDTGEKKLGYLLFILWIIFGVSLFGLYKKPIYDYYFAFMFPLPFLLVGNLIAFLYAQKIVLKSLSIAVLIILVCLNLLGYPFRYIGNNQYKQVRTISEFIINKAGDKPFNFALLTLGNSDHAYRYIFEVEGKTPVTIENTEKDPERKTVTDQLYVVCEDPNCQPLGASLWEVAGFGRAEIAGEWPVSVLKVYKLVPYKE